MEEIDLKNVIPIYGAINDKTAIRTLEQLQKLASSDKTMVTLMILSRGGSVFWGTAIAEAVRLLPEVAGIKINTLGMSSVASMAATIWLAVPKEHRVLTLNSQLFFHQVRSTYEIKLDGRTSATIAELEEIINVERNTQKYDDQLVERLAQETKQSVRSVKRRYEKGWTVSAQEALDLGLAGKII